MIFAWSRMANGDSSFTLTQVLINNVLLIVLYAPIAVFLLGRGDIQIPWDTYVSAVLLYVLSPVIMGYFIRRYLIFKCGSLCGVNKFKHYSKLATKPILLAIVFALFAIQAETILSKPWIVLALIIPIATQAYLVFALTYTWACRQALGPALTGPAALIAASSFFEIALAVSISLFGPASPAVLATTTGILVEIPVMLSLVALSHKLSSCAENRVPDYS
jgi:ACR3 family arsenite transporter